MARKSETMTAEPLKNNMYVLLGVGLVIGFIIGHLYTQVTFLKNGTGGNQPTAAGAQGGDQAAPEAPTKITIAKPDPAKDHWQGPKDARYVLVEYSDLECPFCKRWFDDAYAKIKQEYGNEIGIVFRHFPLSFHPKAEPAARATECVAELGGETAFWKMHDEIFKAMPAMELTQLGDLAASAGVNKAAFQTCLDSMKHKEKVQAHLDEGTKAGVGATPTSVIYDMETGESATIEGALPFESAKQIIDGLMSQGS